MPKSSGSPAATGVGENPTQPTASNSARRIQREESDAFAARLREVIAAESVSSFSRRCGVGESTIRNVLDGAWPRADNLVAFANAGGVTVDWLATGREPKSLNALKALRKGLPRPADVSERCVVADTLPRRDTFLDCTGRLRVFELAQNTHWPGAHIVATEVTDEPPGYRFEAWAEQPGEAIGRLGKKIRQGLARRYLAEDPERGLRVLAGCIAGSVGSGGLIVDGRFIDWGWIENEIQTHEGWSIKIQIKDPAD